MTPYHHLVVCWCRGAWRRELRSQFHRWSTVKIPPFFLKGKKAPKLLQQAHNTSERRPGQFKGFLATFPGRFALIQDWGYCKRKGSHLPQLWLNMHITVVSFNLIAATQLLSLPDLSVFLNFTSSGKSRPGWVVSWELGRFPTRSCETAGRAARRSWCSSDRARPSRCAPPTLSDTNSSVHEWTTRFAGFICWKVGFASS